MPVQTPQGTEFLSCPICYNAFEVNIRRPISLGCGHTVCKHCLYKLQRKQCPFDQTPIHTEIALLPENTALLQLVSEGCLPDNTPTTGPIPGVPKEASKQYLDSKKYIEELALFLKPNACSGLGLNGGQSFSCGTLSRPMQRKLVTLINCQLVEEEGRLRALRATRSLGERSVTELILQHQNAQQLSANLWAAVRARGCQFLGPAMQEEVLKLVLLALEDGSALSRKVLVMYVVQRLAPHFPQASKTSIGHVVQLLYRASCFKVSKREGDSSLMQLKEEFRTYEALRREHDAQIVQIATEAGLRIAPEQWSSLLYGDTSHKSHMQSIIDKLQTPQSFAQSVQELVIALQRTGDPGNLSVLRPHLELLAAIDPSPEAPASVSGWEEVSQSVDSAATVVKGLVEFINNFGNRKLHEDKQILNVKYKTNMCRDLAQRGSCPRGANCTFAHSQDEMEKYRAKTKRVLARSTNGTSSLHLEGLTAEIFGVLSKEMSGNFQTNSGNLSDGSSSSSMKEGQINSSGSSVNYNIVGTGTGTGSSTILADVSLPPHHGGGGTKTAFCQALGESVVSSNGIHHYHHHHYHHHHTLNPDSPPFQPVSTRATGVIGNAHSCNAAAAPPNPPPSGRTGATYTKVNLGASLSCNHLDMAGSNSHSMTPKHPQLTRKFSEGQQFSQKKMATATLRSLQQRRQKLLAQLERYQEAQALTTTISVGGQQNRMSLGNGAEVMMTSTGSFYSPWSSGNLFNSAICDDELTELANIQQEENQEEEDEDDEESKSVSENINKEGSSCVKVKKPRVFRHPYLPSEIDEFIPFDPPLVSKYGPISRSAARLAFLRGCSSPFQVNAVSRMGELTSPTSVVCHPLSSPSPAPSIYPGAPGGGASQIQNYSVPVALLPAVSGDGYLSVVDQHSSIVLPITVPLTSSLKDHLPDYCPEIKMEVDDLCNQMSAQCQLQSGVDQLIIQEEIWAIEKTIQQKEFFLINGLRAEQESLDLNLKQIRPIPTSVGPWPLHQLEQQEGGVGGAYLEVSDLCKDLEELEDHWLNDFDSFDDEEAENDENNTQQEASFQGDNFKAALKI